MKIIKIFAVALMIIVFAGYASGTIHAKKAAKPETTEKDLLKPGACADPAANMILTKALEKGKATVTMKGTICNKGEAGYDGKDPLDAHFMVYTWLPPKTAAQERDLKSISHIKVSKKLNKGECKNFMQTYKIKGITQWGHSVESQTERPASKQFVFRVEKKYPMKASDADFSKTEDCDPSNNAAEQTIDYMEKK
jgi:hypothetical protein